MINPSNIICEVWDMYEWDQYYEVWNRLERSGDTLVWNSEDSEVIDDILYYSEFFYYTTDQILNILEERGEWVNCKHSPLDWESEYDYFPEDVLDWGQEYKLFLEAEYKEDLMYLDVIYDHTQELVLHKGKRYNRKKVKHLHDKLTSPRNVWYCKCERCQMGKVHKHLRARRVYLGEEYNEGQYEYYDDWGEYGCEDFDDDFYSDQYWWKEFAICKPPKGTKVEFKDYSTCTYCGSSHPHCDCFE